MRHFGQFIVSVYKTRTAMWDSLAGLYERCRRPKKRGRPYVSGTELTAQLLPPPGLTDALAAPLEPGKFSIIPKNHIQVDLEQFRKEEDGLYVLKIATDFVYLQSKLVSSVVKEFLVYKYLVDLVIKSFIYNVSKDTSHDELKDMQSLLKTVLIVGVWLSVAEVFFGNLNHYSFKRQVHHTNVNGEEIGEIFTVPFVLAGLLASKDVLPRGLAALTLVFSLGYTVFSRLLGGMGSFHARSYHTQDALWFARLAYLGPPLVSGAFTLNAVPYYFPEFDGALSKTFGVALVPFFLSLIRAYCEFKVERVVLDDRLKDKAYYKFKISAAAAAISAFILNLMQAPVSLALAMFLYDVSCDEGNINFYAPKCFYILLFGFYSALISSIDTWYNYKEAYLEAEQHRLDRGRNDMQWLTREPKLEKDLIPTPKVAIAYRKLTQREKQNFVLYALQLFMAVGDLRVIGLAIAAQAGVYSTEFNDFLPQLMRLDDARSVRANKIAHAYHVLTRWSVAENAASDYIDLMKQVLTLIFIELTKDESLDESFSFDAAVHNLFLQLKVIDKNFMQKLAAKIDGVVPNIALRLKISNQYIVDAQVVNMQKLIKQVFNINFDNDRFYGEFLSLSNPKMARALLLLWLIAHAKGSAERSEDRRTLRILRQNAIIHAARSAASDPVLQAALDALLKHERKGFAENDAVRALMLNASVMNVVAFDYYTASLLGYYIRGFPYESLAGEKVVLRVYREQASKEKALVASKIHDYEGGSLITVDDAPGDADIPLHPAVLLQDQEVNVRDCLEVILRAKSIADFENWIRGTLFSAFIVRDRESLDFTTTTRAPLWFQLFVRHVNKIIATRHLPEVAVDAYIVPVDREAEGNYIAEHRPPVEEQAGGWVDYYPDLDDVVLPEGDDEGEWKRSKAKMGKMSVGERSDIVEASRATGATRKKARQANSSDAGFFQGVPENRGLAGAGAGAGISSRDDRDEVHSAASELDDSFVREYRADSWGPNYPEGPAETAHPRGVGRTPQGPKRVMPSRPAGK